jgi:arginyl-tRNA synthetase
MSSRKGNVLTGESLIADIEEEARAYASTSRAKDIEALAVQVAVAALKYQILRQAVGGNIIFDKAQALSLTGDSGPYLQYTHARTVSIATKAHELGLTADTTHAPSTPYHLEKILYQFPEVVGRAATLLEPHRLVTYLTELAAAFNHFYAEERIADTNDEYAPYKLALTEVTELTLKNGLQLLGMSAPEEM